MEPYFCKHMYLNLCFLHAYNTHSIRECLGEKLGPILFQLPPTFKKDTNTLCAFCGRLPVGIRVSPLLPCVPYSQPPTSYLPHRPCYALLFIRIFFCVRSQLFAHLPVCSLTLLTRTPCPLGTSHFLLY